MTESEQPWTVEDQDLIRGLREASHVRTLSSEEQQRLRDLRHREIVEAARIRRELYRSKA